MKEGIFDPGMGSYPSRVRRDLDVGPRAPLAARWLHKRKPISNQWIGVEFPHRAGRYRPRGSLLFSPGCWSRVFMEICMPGDGTLSSPDAAGPRVGPRGEGWLSHRAGSMNQANQRSVDRWGSGFHTALSGIAPGRSLFSSSGCWSIICMEEFLTREWHLSLPGCVATSTLVPWANMAARWLHEPQPVSNQWAAVVLPYHAGRCRPGG